MIPVEIKVIKYEADDGKVFDTEADCIHHEKILSGERKVCPYCNGTKKVDLCGDGREFWKCQDCNGKGWVSKKVVWK